MISEAKKCPEIRGVSLHGGPETPASHVPAMRPSVLRHGLYPARMQQGTRCPGSRTAGLSQCPSGRVELVGRVSLASPASQAAPLWLEVLPRSSVRLIRGAPDRQRRSSRSTRGVVEMGLTQPGTNWHRGERQGNGKGDGDATMPLLPLNIPGFWRPVVS